MRARQLFALLFCAAAPLAHGQMPAKDTVPGANDHPLLSRFEGSKLVDYDSKTFEEAVLPSGKRVADKNGQAAFEGKNGGPSLEIVEGKAMQDGKLKVYVVGHTDNQGVPAQNIELSQKRAESVIKALAADYKVDAKRLSAKGVASYAPVASNDADAGRQLNRRVELVQQ